MTSQRPLSARVQRGRGREGRRRGWSGGWCLAEETRRVSRASDSSRDEVSWPLPALVETSSSRLLRKLSGQGRQLQAYASLQTHRITTSTCTISVTAQPNWNYTTTSPATAQSPNLKPSRSHQHRQHVHRAVRIWYGTQGSSSWLGHVANHSIDRGIKYAPAT